MNHGECEMDHGQKSNLRKEEERPSCQGQKACGDSDWSSYIGPVQNQNLNTNSSCQTCWAFQTAAVLGGLYNIYMQNLTGTSPNITASAQQLMDCFGSQNVCDMSNNTIAGVMGWYTQNWGNQAWRWIFTNQQWPWQNGNNNTCAYPAVQPLARFSTRMNCGPMSTCNVASSIYELLPNGPALAIVDNNSTAFMHYASGVYAPTTCDGCPCHKVALYGYQTSTSSFMIRNDFGTSWGENGNMRVLRQDSLFSCGVTRQMWFPQIGP